MKFMHANNVNNFSTTDSTTSLHGQA